MSKVPRDDAPDLLSGNPVIVAGPTKFGVPSEFGARHKDGLQKLLLGHESHSPPKLRRTARDSRAGDFGTSAAALTRGARLRRLRAREHPLLADSVAKVPKCLATNFSQKDETIDDRRSMYPQARYRSCP
jgi:hypothetical protein